MGEKMGERISPPNTWKHTTEFFLSSERKSVIPIFVRHLQLRLGII